MLLFRSLVMRLALAFGLLAAFAATPAVAQLSNKAVHDQIKRDLKKHSALAKIQVTVDRGEVVLTGTVMNALQQQQAGRIAHNDAPGMVVLNYVAIQRKPH